MRVSRPSYTWITVALTRVCFILIILISLLYIFKSILSESKSEFRNDSQKLLNNFRNNSRPLILLWGRNVKRRPQFWNAYPGIQKILRGDNLSNYIYKGRFHKEQCCAGVDISIDKNDIQRANAVVMFHQRIIIKRLPKCRKADQLWVLFGKESPAYSTDLTRFNGIFNWTMNYRKDSDVPVPYGDFTKLEFEQPDININGMSLEDFIKRKRALMTAVISHCSSKSKREEYIKLLEREGNITIDIYGKCGTPQFNRYDYKGSFWEDLAQEYKFFFASENSICSDYITEKFWRTLKLGMVPVVYGGADYKVLAPPGSFIDVRDFRNLKELAEHLVMLDINLDEYKKYFEWKKKYQVQVTDAWHNWCGLCKQVKEFVEMGSQNAKIYEDLGEWWKRKRESSEELACER